jgi:glyoxylate reductase
MRSKRPFVIVPRKLPDSIETRMMELFACRLNLDDQPLSKAELIAAVAQADVLVPTVTDRIDAQVLAGAGSALKLIASFGTGVDHVDLAAAQQRGIIVNQHPRRLNRGHRRYDDGVDPRRLAPARRG